MIIRKGLRQVAMGASVLVAGTAWAAAAQTPDYGPELERFDYPHEVKRYRLDTQGQALTMAYMDVAAKKPNGKTVVLMHGKNFCGATWDASITALTDAGYRVVVPDQIGFCKSSKPAHYQYSFHQLAADTQALLDSLGIGQAAIVGHSMGGMLAARYALMFPAQTTRLVMVNPIGLEDWKQLGVPYRSIDEWYARELKATAQGIKQYQLNTYYAGKWRDDYDKWVDMAAGMLQGEGRERVAWNQALTYDMIYTQPVVHEFGNIKVPTTLLIGEKDNTAPGKDAAPPALAKTLGDYPALGPKAAKAIPDAQLVTFPALGHSPQVQDPTTFHRALLNALNGAGDR